MNPGVQRWLRRGFGRCAQVPISDCVHYGGFRYGRGEYNPYETYLQQLLHEGSEAARSRFIEFLRHYRPRHLGAALGLELKREYALWHYPWSRLSSRTDESGAWCDDPDDCPDILTHFSDRGILVRRIEEEFVWLERAMYSIRRHGFQPDRFGDPLFVQKLVGRDGRTAHLMLDGNHRLSALSALGETMAPVHWAPWSVVREEHLARWPLVRDGSYETEDARKVFHAIFNGNQCPRTCESPAPLLRFETRSDERSEPNQP